MAIENIFVSGTQQINGVNFTSPPQIPGTFTKELVMTGQVALSAYAGSYQETSLTRPIWTADAAAQVVAVYERHSVLGSTTAMLVHAIGSTSLGSSANVLASTIPGTSAVDVYNTGTLIGSTTLTQLATGDQLGWRWTTPGNLAPTGVVTLVLSYI